MPNAYGKTKDKTFLSIDNAEERGFIHRDYIAHCLRWSHVVKYLQEKNRYKTAHILDIGCGREVPLLKTLYTSRLMPHTYVGIDLGPIDLLPILEKYTNAEPDQPHYVMSYDKTDFLDFTFLFDVNGQKRYPDVITAFEVLEHMEADTGIDFLLHVVDHMEKDRTVFFMSTPRFNGSAAANHVHEWEYKELKQVLLLSGFKIQNHWGTFASIRDYEVFLYTYPGLKDIFDKLRGYYDVNYLATVFAPMFPEHSRNVLWELVI